MRGQILFPLLWALAGTLAACGGGEPPSTTPSLALVGAPEGQPGTAASLSGQQLDMGTELLALENANLRHEPSASAALLAVVPRDATVRVLESTPRDGYYKVSLGGLQGWSYGAHYAEQLSRMSRQQALTANDILSRAASGVGFSYWWGHGRWSPGSTSRGSCSGNCPSCSHSGSYGADCSGYVAKVWQVPSSNGDVTVDSHPYSTVDFENTTISWDGVSRGSAQPGDAFVYNSGGAGHIFIYEKNDPWGTMLAYECKGCATGCVYNQRTAGSDYKVIRRRGLTPATGGTSDPTATTWGPGRLDVFVRGVDKALWHRWYDSGTWYPWQSLGGILNSGPDAVSWGTGRLDVFARNTNNDVVHKFFVSGTGWSAWVNEGAPPGGANSDPSVVSWGPNRLDVFVRGGDNALWHKWFDNGTWYGWQSLGGILTSSPDASAWAPGRLDVFARDTNDNVVQKFYAGGGDWSPWMQRGSSATSAPGAVSWAPDRIDVFARGSDNSLIHQYWNGSTWSAWISEGGILNSGPDVTSWGAGRLDVMALNTNNDVVHKWFVSGTGWSTWETLGSPE